MSRLASSLLGLSLLFCPALIAAEQAPPEAAIRNFGAPIEIESPTRLAEIVAHPERYGEGPVLIRGRITDVCQKKGCWTVLAEGDAHVRIRFKDYGFFLPMDIRGQEALAEGEVKIESQSEKQARHYAAESIDGDPESIVGPQRVVSFTASGVRLVGVNSQETPKDDE